MRRSTDCVYNRQRNPEIDGLYGVVDQALPAAVSDASPVSLTESSYADTAEGDITEVSETSPVTFNDMPSSELNIGSHWPNQPQQQLQAASIALSTGIEVCSTRLLLDQQSVLDEETASMDFDFTRLQDCTSGLNAALPHYNMMRSLESVSHHVTQAMNSTGGLFLTLTQRRTPNWAKSMERVNKPLNLPLGSDIRSNRLIQSK